MPNIHSLPEKLFLKIAACLDDLDLCNMELASKRFHDIMLRPSATAAGSFSLDLFEFRPDTPGQFRLPCSAASFS